MIEVSVCVGSSCHLKGSHSIIQTLRGLIENTPLNNDVEMQAQFCMKRCQEGVAVSVNGEYYSVSPETVGDFFQKAIAAKIAAEE